jgi:hypothetical protein
MAPIYEFNKEQSKAIEMLGIGKRRNDLEKQTQDTSQIADQDTSNWVMIPHEFTNGKYSLIFDPARISHNSGVEKVGKELGINYENISKDSLGREFIGENNWSDSLKLNLGLGNKTMNTQEFTDAGKLLYLGMQGEIKVYNAKGDQIKQETLKGYFEDIFQAKSPWRAEWIDADFKSKNDKLYINFNHRLNNQGILVPKNSQILAKNTLMQDKTPGISLESWIGNPTRQGLPKDSTNEGDLHYWSPGNDNNSVARFDASSVRAGLNCYGDPSSWYSFLGVRAAKLRE